ncbi:replication protein A 30 kDa subunit [Hippopotamus amphibius kiboko]|uniref:replication protein A 30 kDa subunit n=1 Tax=Hippopotamus amphibius kiboko TaxID=575201 RepID=UPI0025915AF7|nr:replication protein A 30 kDa subunit [Hippopotamus amphibius kiboko]
MKKNGFGRYRGKSAEDGASGSNDPPSQGRVALATQSILRPRARIQDIVPCCVNQLLTSTLVDDVFKIRGIEVSQVSIVGIIRQAENAANYFLYKIDDMTTKPIEVHQWVGKGKAKQKITLLPVGVYVKVFGILKCSAEVKSLEVLKIRVLEDMNEFTTHILETVNAHMMLEKARQAASGQSLPVAPLEMDEAQMPEYHPDFVQKEVLRLICECPQQEGKSVHELQNELRNLSIGTIKQAIDYLTTEGHIYPTVDAEHFKSAE